MISIEKANLYEKYRLPYAPQAVEDLVAYIGKIQVVADIGAGTGQLARLFARRCPKVVAIEPDPAMRQVASSALMNFPNIEIREGYAEQTTLAENSVDLIVIGNAFHRFKPDACQELRRVLKPAGWVALFSYKFLNKAFTEMLFTALNEMKNLPNRIAKSSHRLPVQALFGESHIQLLSYEQSLAEDWTAFFGAACAGIEAPEPSDQDFEQFEAVNRRVFDSFAIDGEIHIDYETLISFGQPLFLSTSHI